MTAAGKSQYQFRPWWVANQVAARAATTPSATVQSSPITKPYQKRQKRRKKVTTEPEKRGFAGAAVPEHLKAARSCTGDERNENGDGTAWPGQATPAPSAAQNVPNDVRKIPTTNFRVFSGTRLSGR